jgi:hypothetical protein
MMFVLVARLQVVSLPDLLASYCPPGPSRTCHFCWVAIFRFYESIFAYQPFSRFIIGIFEFYDLQLGVL